MTTSVLPGDAMLARLNPAQHEAVMHGDGPMLVLAGAGSGKTRVLTTRIARLVEQHGVDPRQILAVTFTNKAAGEMKERVARLLGAEPAGMWAGTFHSVGARLLRREAHRSRTGRRASRSTTRTTRSPRPSARWTACRSPRSNGARPRSAV